MNLLSKTVFVLPMIVSPYTINFPLNEKLSFSLFSFHKTQFPGGEGFRK